jgi:phosphatidylserine/phosphatidylglycerophosphate/cardiolipin synthase-like enzyme
VTIEEALATVLERLGDAQVAALARACEPLSAPTGALTGIVAGAPPAASDGIVMLCAAWRDTPLLTGAGIALALRTGLAARHQARAQRARPVWTGPGSAGEQRLTAGVLHELLSGARQRVLLVSFAAYTLPEVAGNLEAAVHRGCAVDVVFETEEDSAGAYSGPSRPFAQLSGITRWHWPAQQRDGGGVLHAKLLVVDGRRALVGSANLTAKALAHNLEVGLVTHDVELASQLEAHIRRLMDTGVLRREESV